MKRSRNGNAEEADCLMNERPEPILDDEPTCPVCGLNCEVYFMNEAMQIVGCEHCVRRLNARENQWATVY